MPRKNIRSFLGKPLIAWAIEQASATRRIDRIIVSTDSLEIAGIARDYGAEVPFIRPSDLARDDTPEWAAWQHALNYLTEIEGSCPELFVSIPTTAPLRKPEDIDRCIAEYDRGHADIVITTTSAHRSPYFNMVRSKPDGSVELVIPLSNTFTRRQETPEIYDMTTVCYVGNPQFITSHNSLFEGRVRSIYVPPERAIDIDTIMDFRIAEFLGTQRQME